MKLQNLIIKLPIKGILYNRCVNDEILDSVFPSLEIFFTANKRLPFTIGYGNINYIIHGASNKCF